MKRLLLSLFGLMTRRDHQLQVFGLRRTVKDQAKIITQLKQQVNELQSAQSEKEESVAIEEKKTLAYPSKDERVFINIIKEIASKPFAPTLTENNKYIGTIKDDQLYISNTHLVEKYNQIHGTSLKILPVEFTKQALERGFIKPSRWKQNPAVHRLYLPCGKRVSHVAIDADISTFKQTERKNA